MGFRVECRTYDKKIRGLGFLRLGVPINIEFSGHYSRAVFVPLHDYKHHTL